MDKKSRRLESVAAASLYFTFLGMPGSGAFKIFHPLLFTKALDVFKVRIGLARKDIHVTANIRWWYCSKQLEQVLADKRGDGRLK